MGKILNFDALMSFKVKQDTKDRIIMLAKADGRSESNYSRKVLEDHVEVRKQMDKLKKDMGSYGAPPKKIFALPEEGKE